MRKNWTPSSPHVINLAAGILRYLFLIREACVRILYFFIEVM